MSYYSIALTGKISAAHVGTTTQSIFVYRPSMACEFFELLSRCNTMHQVRAMTGEVPRDTLSDSYVQGVMSKQCGGNPIPIKYVEVALSNGEGLLGESSNGYADLKTAISEANKRNRQLSKNNGELCEEVKRLEGLVMDGVKKRDAIYELYHEAANKLMLISDALEK